MMEGAVESKRSLDVLPQKINESHRCLREAMEKLCVLEEFLLGDQVREVAPGEDREPPSGVVDRCFDNLAGISNSIDQFHGQLIQIIDKLGISSKEAPGKL